jgi:hypothetical protein
MTQDISGKKMKGDALALMSAGWTHPVIASPDLTLFTASGKEGEEIMFFINWASCLKRLHSSKLHFRFYPLFDQRINPIKEHRYRRDPQPMGMKRTADIAMKKKRNSMA